MQHDINSLEARAKAGDAESQFQLSTHYHAKCVKRFSQHDLELCLHWLTRASEQKHVKATTNLAIFYFFGDGVEQSYEKAFPLLTRSSTDGDESASYYLALCYLNGYATSPDPRKAVSLFLGPSSAGMPEAQLSLANCYRDGVGLKADLFEAVGWYAHAAQQGLPEAEAEFNRLYYSTPFTDEAGRQRLLWFEKDHIRATSGENAVL